MPKIQAIGIDLGTTYSVVARLDEHGKTQIVRNEGGDILTPSVVLFDDKEIIVGKEAKKVAVLDADRVAEYVKRDMGNTYYSKPIRGEQIPPEVVQACILRKLGADAKRECGTNNKAVITVPAYFDEPRRKATADAGEMAGIDVLDIVNEPTAAALAFGEHLGYLNRDGAPNQDLTVLVYDLGGGTFDVTVIELRPGHFRTLATDGDVRLGGHDWDTRLADFLAQQFRLQHGIDPRSESESRVRLLRTAEEAKHTLSIRSSAPMHLEYGGKSTDLTITRKKFQELTEDLLERTIHTTRQVLRAAAVGRKQISRVLLVGGSTRMPIVSRMLEKLLKMKPEHVVNPDEAVARGAAIYAGYLLANGSAIQEQPPKAAFEVTDVNAHSLGIQAIDQDTLRRENRVLIPRNTPLPFRKQEQFVTQAFGQQSVVVQVLEGESLVPDECSQVARAVMRRLPAGLPKGYPIDVTYEYGTNGRLKVNARLSGGKQALGIELERERGLSDERIARWRTIFSSDSGFISFEEALQDVAAATETAVSPFLGRSIPVATPIAQDARREAAPNRPTSTLFEEDPPLMPIAQPIHHPPRDTTAVAINVGGHLLAAVLGLALAYYILCFFAPQANFLNLDLPGLPLPPASSDEPASKTKP